MPRHTRNELKAGVLILVAFAALCLAIVVIADFDTWFLPTAVYQFRFERVEGLKVGDDVMYAGMRAGRVAKIEVKEDTEKTLKPGETRAYVLVTVELDKRFPLRSNDQPSVDKGFTGNVALGITPYKRHKRDTEEQATGELLKPGDVLVAKHTPGFSEVLAMSGDLMEMIEDLKGKASDVMDTVNTEIKGLAKQANDTIGDIRLTIGENRENIRQFTENARKISEKVDGVAGSVDHKAVRDVIDNVNQSAAATRRKLDELLPKLDDIIRNIELASGNMKTATGNVAAASEDVKRTTAEVRETVIANRPHVDGMMEESHQAAARLNIGMEDIRRNPWKLLTRNIEADAYTQNIYDATLRFAEGARSLALASQSLNALQTQPDASPEAVQRAKDNLKKLAEDMPRLEAMLFEALQKRPR